MLLCVNMFNGVQRAQKDVKSLMAHFNTVSSPILKEGVRPKLSTHSVLSAGSSPLVKMDNLKKTPSMGTIITATTQASKPAFRRTFDTPVREGPEATVPKPPPFKPKFTETNQDAKSQKPGFSSQPKPPLSALKLPLTPIRKSSLMSGLQAQQGQEIQRGEHWTPPTPKPPTPQTPPKPQQGGGRGWGHAVRGAFRSSFIHSVPPKPPAAKKPSFAPGPSGGRERLVHQQKSDNPSAPKKKTVPDAFTLGNPPMKPNRPTHIDLQRFQQGGKGQNGEIL